MELTKELINIFTDWTKLKISLHISEKEIYFNSGQIWWVSLGQNIGSEQNGKNINFERPILILKKFNAGTFLSVPISTKIKKGQYYYIFTNEHGTFCVNLSQIRLISSKRLLRLTGKMNKTDFDTIRTKIKEFL